MQKCFAADTKSGRVHTAIPTPAIPTPIILTLLRRSLEGENNEKFQKTNPNPDPNPNT